MRAVQLQNGLGIHHLQLSEQVKPNLLAEENLVKLEASEYLEQGQHFGKVVITF